MITSNIITKNHNLCCESTDNLALDNQESNVHSFFTYISCGQCHTIYTEPTFMHFMIINTPCI
jgi:hypothetical protein